MQPYRLFYLGNYKRKQGVLMQVEKHKVSTMYILLSTAAGTSNLWMKYGKKHDVIQIKAI